MNDYPESKNPGENMEGQILLVEPGWYEYRIFLEFHRVPRAWKDKSRSQHREQSELHLSPSVCSEHQKCTQLATGCHCSLTLLGLGVLWRVSVHEYAKSQFTTVTEGTDSPVQTSSIWNQLLFLHKIDFRFWEAQKGLEEMSDLKCSSQF